MIVHLQDILSILMLPPAIRLRITSIAAISFAIRIGWEIGNHGPLEGV